MQNVLIKYFEAKKASVLFKYAEKELSSILDLVVERPCESPSKFVLLNTLNLDIH